ncbi:hypothetical protein SCORR_v1c02590 [Spiroplasma corruscae]|uniref:Lipoprotein n=1 Tax=Spiroplasma corruscae TaxID=216934 RepID=A0A222EP34_9MOLU|nr:hypothetical protein [Spiroplasma corruscae]ASP28033.1 hypothetical protein SCORR_v1c02590 [Spiroplasma corruscae]
MKKILATLSVLTIATSSAATVVSCSSNVHYKEFLQWINNKETFLLYIGAKDCDFCQKFESNIEYNKQYFDDKLNQISGEYNNNVSSLNNLNDSFTGYGETLNNNLNLRQFVIDEKANNFKEKWSENIVTWLVDKLTEVYYELTLNIGSNETIQKNVAKEKVKEYFDKIKATPMFLIIRNGKVVDWEVGFEEDTTGWVDKSLESLVSQIGKSFLDSEIEAKLVNKINTGSATESGGETSGGNGAESGGETSEGSGGETTSSESRSISLSDVKQYNSSKYDLNFDSKSLIKNW